MRGMCQTFFYDACGFEEMPNKRCLLSCDVPFPTLGPLSSGVLPQNRTSYWKGQLNSKHHESFNSETDVIPLGPGKLDIDT